MLSLVVICPARLLDLARRPQAELSERRLAGFVGRLRQGVAVLRPIGTHQGNGRFFAARVEGEASLPGPHDFRRGWAAVTLRPVARQRQPRLLAQLVQCPPRPQRPVAVGLVFEQDAFVGQGGAQLFVARCPRGHSQAIFEGLDLGLAVDFQDRAVRPDQSSLSYQ